MLNAVGVPAQLALVNINQTVLPGLPNIDQFDHMIVSVPVDNGRLYIDATDKDLRLGTTPPRYMAGNHALVLLPIPEFTVGDSGLQVERDIEPIPGDEIRVTEIGVFSGYQAADMRGQLREIEVSDMLGTMQRWVADRYSDAIVDDAFVDNVFDASGELVVELQYRLPIDTGPFKLPGFFEATFLDYERLPERRFGFDIPAPLTASTVTTVHPQGSGQETGRRRIALRQLAPDNRQQRRTLDSRTRVHRRPRRLRVGRVPGIHGLPPQARRFHRTADDDRVAAPLEPRLVSYNVVEAVLEPRLAGTGLLQRPR